MTGMELLTGLSFVDERFVAEADTVTLGRKIPWMKVLSVAACLCILVVGALALDNIGYKGAMEEAAAPAAAPEAVPEAAPEAAPPMPESMTEDSKAEESPIPPYAVEEEIPSGELQHVPHAALRIVKVLDDGSFEAVVEAVTREPTPLELGLQLTLVIDPGKVPDGGERTDVEYETTADVDQRIEIENGAYDAEFNILYVEGIISVQ